MTERSMIKQDLELLNYHNTTDTELTSKDYQALIHDVGELFGATVIGSDMSKLGPLIELYAIDASKRFGLLYTSVADIQLGIRSIRHKYPMPPKPRKVLLKQENSRYIRDVITAVDSEIDIRCRCKRMIDIPERFQQSSANDSDGQFITGSRITIAEHIVNGLLAKDPEATEIFAELMIVAPERTVVQ